MLNILLGLLFAITAILVGWAVISGGADVAISWNLIWGYALLVGAVVCVLWAALKGTGNGGYARNAKLGYWHPTRGYDVKFIKISQIKQPAVKISYWDGFYFNGSDSRWDNFDSPGNTAVSWFRHASISRPGAYTARLDGHVQYIDYFTRATTVGGKTMGNIHLVPLYN